ncbi:MarR family transcriptional regulator [Streptomyces sp. NBC_00523]|uniref:MarR family winged helix-turn-helix transcriptional regulator n=1 Tax=unclassified Streptomyces TaxID=2593676 RepID=UPI002E806867|nr:MarR family transcriptional regulator [Streptomyces sp. NBC_00523]WUD02958.1 MarR family transcriptional regulator [Streptomyces sp. NBC_00523]
MTVPDAAPSNTWHEATRSASALTELLDVMWEHARHSTTGTTAPSSTSQLRLMYVVDRENGIRMRTVCQRLASAPPTVTRMCDRLQAIGLLERRPCPDNGREVTLRLTRTGKEHLQRIREQRDTMLHQAIDRIPPTERAALAIGLAALQAQLDTAAGERPHVPADHSAA